MQETKKKTNKALWWKIPTGIIISLIGIFGLAWGTLNASKYAIYSEFFNAREKLGNIPGINEGFTPQGVTAIQEKGITLLTGYQKDPTKASRIYVIDDKTKETHYVEIMTKDNKPFIGHNEGIAYYHDNVFISTDRCLYILDLNDILNKDNKTVTFTNVVALVDNASQFVFTNDEYLLVGEFYRKGSKYEENRPNVYNTSDGEYHAICEEYKISDVLNNDNSLHPTRCFAIRSDVQGLAMNEKGDIVMSTSWGVNSSLFYYYKASDMKIVEGVKHKDAPLIYLDHPCATLKAPAMTEAMDYVKGENGQPGKWYTITESACDKYIFGKLFFSDYYYNFTWDIK